MHKYIDLTKMLIKMFNLEIYKVYPLRKIYYNIEETVIWVDPTQVIFSRISSINNIVMNNSIFRNNYSLILSQTSMFSNNHKRSQLTISFAIEFLGN